MTIEFSRNEIYMAKALAQVRIDDAIKSGNPPRWGTAWGDSGSRRRNLVGVLGELAVARSLNIYFSGGFCGSADVGEFEVRATERENGRLILHPSDKDHSVFVLVTGVNLDKFTANVRGWILAADGKKPEFWDDPTFRNKPAFFIEPKLLQPMKDLSNAGNC